MIWITLLVVLNNPACITLDSFEGRCPYHPHAMVSGGMWGSMTLMGTDSYYIEGVFHYHDPNTSSTSYFCSEGHTIYVSSHPGCPAGDVKGRTSLSTCLLEYRHEPWDYSSQIYESK